MKIYKTKRRAIDAQAPGGIPPTCGAVFAVCAVFLLMCVTVAPAIAQTEESQCGLGDGSGSDIRACAGDLLDSQERTISLLEEMTNTIEAMGVLSSDQMEAARNGLAFMRERHDRGQEDLVDTTDDEFEAAQMKSGKKTMCRFKEILDDSFGNEDGVCQGQERKENACEEVCEFANEDRIRNRRKGQRSEQDMATMLEQADLLNDELESEMESLAALSSAGFFAASLDPCTAPSPHNFGPFGPGALLATASFKGAAATAIKVADVGCKQTIVGNNIATACTWLWLLEGLASEALAWMNTLNGNFTSATVDANLACSNSISAEVAQQGNDLQQLKMDMAEVKTLLGEVKDLLNTPQGLREDFPTK